MKNEIREEAYDLLHYFDRRVTRRMISNADEYDVKEIDPDDYGPGYAMAIELATRLREVIVGDTIYHILYNDTELLACTQV